MPAYNGNYARPVPVPPEPIEFPVAKVYEAMYINGEPVYAGDSLDIMMAYGGKNAS